MIKKGFEAPRMAKPKKNHSTMKEMKIQKLNMAPIFIISINTITSLQEMKVELEIYEFSSQEDQ